VVPEERRLHPGKGGSSGAGLLVEGVGDIGRKGKRKVVKDRVKVEEEELE
jgi:hypothetical protein